MNARTRLRTFVITALLVLTAQWSFALDATAQNFRIAADADNLIVAVEPESNRDVANFNRRYAADELSRYLEKVTGTKVAVTDKVSAARIQKGGVIFVGPSEYTDAHYLGRDANSFGAGGYLIKTIGNNLYILGHDTDDAHRLEGRLFGDTGTYYGVAGFLEKFCDVRWLWPGELGTVVPQHTEVIVPAQTDINSRPASLNRKYSEPMETVRERLPNGKFKVKYGSNRPHNVDWLLFHRRLGGGGSMRLTGSHMLKSYLTDKDFEEHPEYFAYYNGKRQPHVGAGAQFCMSNPDVVKFVADKVIKRALKLTYEERQNVTFSIGPNDGSHFCMCDECKKMDVDIKPWPADVKAFGQVPGKYYNERFGMASDLSNRVWTFNNEVAKLVAKGAPGAQVGCYAYSYYTQPPTQVPAIEENLIPILCDYYWTIGGPDKYEQGNEFFESWGKKSPKFGVYNYYFTIGSIPRRTAEMVRRTSEMGAIGYVGETTQTFGFKWIQYVVHMRAIWNPKLDVEALIKDHYTAAYGPGAQAMLKYLDLQEKVSLGYNGYTSFQSPKVIADNWNKSVRTQLRGYLDEALAATKDTPDCQDRVRFTEEAWELLDAYCELTEQMRNLKEMGMPIAHIDALKPQDGSPAKLAAAITEAAVQVKRVRDILHGVEAKRGWSVPWHSIFVYATSREGKVIFDWGQTVDILHKQVLLAGGISLPSQWAFKIDPKEQGRSAGWFESSFNDATWSKFRTDDVWENQGYGPEQYPANTSEGYNGKAWYRTSVTIPAERQGRKTFLELGAVDESCTVWVNGQIVGTFDFHKQDDKDAWQKAQRFDITNVALYGQPNVIAVEVGDKQGAGGIWKPCYIVFDEQEKVKQPVTLRNGSFEDPEHAPWRFNGKGDYAAEIKTYDTPPAPDNKRYLHTRLGKGDNLHVSLTHSDMDYRSLDVSNRQMYRLKFQFRGEEHDYLARRLPISIRVIYLNPSLPRGHKDRHRYDWIPLRPTDDWQTKQVIVQSPDSDKWTQASVTVFVKRAGEYDWDDFVLEAWE